MQQIKFPDIFFTIFCDAGFRPGITENGFDAIVIPICAPRKAPTFVKKSQNEFSINNVNNDDALVIRNQENRHNSS